MIIPGIEQYGTRMFREIPMLMTHYYMFFLEILDPKFFFLKQDGIFVNEHG